MRWGFNLDITDNGENTEGQISFVYPEVVFDNAFENGISGSFGDLRFGETEGG